jgi:Holliday junction resolvase RusA-like endonuclease
MYELDGEYNIKTTTNYEGVMPKKSDGMTRIENGQTHRVDDAGCEWRSTFEVISETEVKMTSVADPVNADIDFLLTKPNGDLTSEPVTYEAVLKLQRKGEKLQMSGSINFGNETIFITMRKIS